MVVVVVVGWVAVEEATPHLLFRLRSVVLEEEVVSVEVEEEEEDDDDDDDDEDDEDDDGFFAFSSIRRCSSLACNNGY